MTFRGLLRVFGVVLTLAGAVGLGIGPFAAEPTYAKGNGAEGKGGSNAGGNGGGKGNDKGGKSNGDRGGKSAGKAGKSKADKLHRQAKQNGSKRSAGKGLQKLEAKLNNFFAGNKKTKKTTQRTARASTATKPSKTAKEHRVSHGKIASELKGLNAAHASQTALINASPNSMPGKLYTYQQAILDYDSVDKNLMDAQQDLEDLMNLSPDDPQFQPTEEEIAQGITAQDKYDDAVSDAEKAVADAEDALNNTDPDAAANALNDAQSEVDRLNGLSPDDPEFTPTEEETAEGITAQDKYDDAVAAAQQDLDAAQERFDTVLTDPQDALDTLTGGRELSPEAQAELHNLLGLDPPKETNPEIDAAEAVDPSLQSEG